MACPEGYHSLTCSSPWSGEQLPALNFHMFKSILVFLFGFSPLVCSDLFSYFWHLPHRFEDSSVSTAGLWLSGAFDL